MNGVLNIKKIDPTQIKYKPLEGEVIETPDGKYLIWKEGQWHTFQFQNGGIDLKLYDMNKQIIAQLPDLTDWEEKAALVDNLHNKFKNEFYMLYGKEISYFTLFDIKDGNLFASVLFECLKSVGSVKAIDMTEAEDALEIWVTQDDEVTCMYLFPYDMGLVQVGGELNEENLLRTTYV